MSMEKNRQDDFQASPSSEISLSSSQECEACGAGLSRECIKCLFDIPRVPDAPVEDPAKISSAEGMDIRSAVDKVLYHQRILRKKMAYLEGLLFECHRSVKDHQLFLDKYRPALSLPDRIPWDLWKQIFLIITNDSPSPSVSTRCSSIHFAALNLSHVNSSWRSFIMATPELWQQVEFRIDRRVPDSKLKLMNLFLSRGDDCPLDIRVVMDASVEWKDLNSKNQTAMKSLMAMLLHHSRRWQKVWMKIPSSLYQLESWPVETPILKSLTMYTHDLIKTRTGGWSPVLIISAPQLTKFVLGNFVAATESDQAGGLSAVVPYSSLEEFEISAFDDSTLIRHTRADVTRLLTDAAAHLKKLTLRIQSSSSGDGGPFEFPNLEHLIYISLTSDFLPSLTLPKLSILTIARINFTSPTHFAELVVRSPELKEVRFFRPRKLPFARMFPPSCGVEEVQIGLSNPFSIEEGPENFPLSLLDFANGCLPSLKRLEVWICFNKEQDEDGQSAPIPGVIEQLARAFENKPLDKFRVEVYRKTLHDETLEAFFLLRAKKIRGLEIVITNLWRKFIA